MKFIKTVGYYDIFEVTKLDCGEGYKCGSFLAFYRHPVKYAKCFDKLETAENWCLIETWGEQGI